MTTAERRLFVAVPLPDDAVSAVTDLVERVRAGHVGEGRDVRWVRMDGLHLTLRFLGPTPEHLLDPTIAAVGTVAREATPFDIAIRGAGAFPSAARPRALWLGIWDPTGALADLATQVQSALVSAGWPPDDRPFRPHLTLARSDGVSAGPGAARRLAEASADLALTARVDHLVLFESVTGGGPARYVPVVSEPLGER